MVKCGPKPRKLTARELRNLVREEKRTLSLRRQAVQAPPSPRRKKVWVRPCQFDVSLARKKRVKNYPRQVVPRKARSVTSVAFSAMTEEIPLFEELKRTHRLVYVHVPQQPVPLVWPQTPTRETSRVRTITSVNGRATPTAKSEYSEISGPALNFSSWPNDEQLCLLSTPIASSTPLLAPSCAVEVQVLSPVYLEDKLQNIHTLDQGVFHDETAVETSSPKLALGTMFTHSGNSEIRCVSASEEGSSISEAHTFVAPSWTIYEKSNILTDQLPDFDPAPKEDPSRPQDSSSLSLDKVEQCNKLIVLPTIRPHTIQRRVQCLQPSHILSQLPIEQDPETIPFPRVQLPGTVLRSPVSVNQSMPEDSPETIYYRSLVPFWTETSEHPNVKDKPRLEGLFPLLQQDSGLNPAVGTMSEQSISTLSAVSSVHSRQNEDSVLATEKTTSVIEYSPCHEQHYSCSDLVQPDSINIVQLIKPTPNTHTEDSTPSSFKLKRRIFGIYRGHNGLGVDRTTGAFANAVLRQTGHLRQKDSNMPAADVLFAQNDYPFKHDTTAMKHVKNSGIQDQYISSRFQRLATPFNNMGYQRSSHDTLQGRSRMDELKVPLAPAAVIKDDPFKRPLVRPSRKRFFSSSRVLADKLENNPYGRSELHKTNSTRDPLGEKIAHARPIINEAAMYSQNPDVPRPPVMTDDTSSTSLRQTGHWAKRVAVDDICDHASTDIGALSIPSQGRSDQSRVHTMPLQAVHSQPQMPLAAVPPSESEQTMKKQEFGKKGTVFTGLKAIFNKLLWA